MRQEVKPTTQYGDFVGEAACDGYGGGLANRIAELAGVSEEYFALGIDAYYGENGFFTARLVVCDKERYGDSIDKITSNAKNAGEIETKLIDLELTAEELLKHVKRLGIVIRNQNLSGIRLVTSDEL